MPKLFHARSLVCHRFTLIKHYLINKEPQPAPSYQHGCRYDGAMDGNFPIPLALHGTVPYIGFTSL